MPRFIDEEKIDFRLPYYPDEDSGDALVSLKTVKRSIAMTPTEDVVPKSEVEVWKQNRFNLYQRLELYEMTRQKVAREIFEEIEEVFRQHTEGGYYLNGTWFPERLDLYTGDAIAELKKKYTEQTPKDYFSPEDVQRMTAKDVRDNYTAVMESMKKWK